MDAFARDVFISFTNTMDWHASEHPVEMLLSYDDLVAWAVKAGTPIARAAEGLRAAAKQYPEDAKAVLARAVRLREAIYRVYAAVGDGDAPDGADLTVINEELALALPHLQVESQAGTFVWTWDSDACQLDAILWPVARSAAEQLVASDLDRVKVCADDRGCGYMFYDETRNHSRRWCDMGSCGNRAKAQRHYQRHRSETA